MRYQKGSLFLKTLEDSMGRAAFDGVIHRHFQFHAYRWADDRAFAGLLPDDAALRVDEWLYAPGLPQNVTAPRRAALWDRVLA